jgi:hypothetical protein
MTAQEAMPEITERNLWDVVVHMMDDETREDVNGMDLDYNDDERHDNELFLAAYLERATDDLIVG